MVTPSPLLSHCRLLSPVCSATTGLLSRIPKWSCPIRLVPGSLVALRGIDAEASVVPRSSPSVFPVGPVLVGGLLLALVGVSGVFWWSSRVVPPAPVVEAVSEAVPAAGSDWSAAVLENVEPVAVQVSLASEPSGASVLVDGMSVGRTPWVGSLAIDDGVHQRLELKIEGFRPQTVHLAIEDGQAAQTVRLEALPQPAPKPAPRVPAVLPSETRSADASSPAAEPESMPATPTPRPTPEPEPTPAPQTTVEGVPFSAVQADRTLAMANEGTKERFNAAGIRTQEFNRVLAGRPYSSISAVAAAPGVGPKTLQRMRDSAP